MHERDWEGRLGWTMGRISDIALIINSDNVIHVYNKFLLVSRNRDQYMRPTTDRMKARVYLPLSQ